MGELYPISGLVAGSALERAIAERDELARVIAKAKSFLKDANPASAHLCLSQAAVGRPDLAAILLPAASIASAAKYALKALEEASVAGEDFDAVEYLCHG